MTQSSLIPYSAEASGIQSTPPHPNSLRSILSNVQEWIQEGQLAGFCEHGNEHLGFIKSLISWPG
jgi:hypothetical protein